MQKKVYLYMRRIKMVYEVKYENYYECKDVCKDVLWMYHDIIVSYGGFGHNLDFETIDYEKYFFSFTEDELQYCHIVRLLSQGSVVALCCEAVNFLDEENRDKKFYELISKLLDFYRINHMPFEKEVLSNLKNALDEEPSVGWEQLKLGAIFYQSLIKVYNNYVLGYYMEQIAEGKKG
jgi:hypothetical protein